MKKSKSISKVLSLLFIAAFALIVFTACYIPRNGLYENPQGVRYFKNDVYQTGWIEVDGHKNYFSKINGYRINKPTSIEGIFTYFNEDGTLVDGFYKEEGGTVYCLDGIKVFDWQEIEGKKYYFYKETGYMATGSVAIGGKTYVFDSNGALLGSDTVTPE